MDLIDIRKIKTVFICPDHNEMYKKRCNHMFSLLKEYGFEHVIHYKSGSLDPYPLNLATCNILQMNLNEPVLILEDDIEFISNPRFIFEIPHSVDALYLGLSGCNYNFETKTNETEAKFEIINSNYARVLNMLGAHAILYLSKEYKLQIANALKNATIANDIEICKYQSKYNLYVLRKPICWQSAKFNKSWIEYITKVEIDDYAYLVSFS